MKKKRGIIEKLVIGTPSEKDFSESDLPSNRFRQFGFVLRTRFGTIFRTNLVAALFFLPLLTWEILSSLYVNDFNAGLQTSELFSWLLPNSLLQYGVEIPLFAVAAAGLAGAFYVVRRLCWGQSVRLFADFGKGIRDSGRQFAVLGLLFGVVNFAVNYFFRFILLVMPENNVFWWIFGLIAVCLTAVLAVIFFMYAFSLASLYSQSFGKLIKNGFILTFACLWKNLLIAAAAFVPVAVCFFLPWVFARLAGCCLVVTLGIGYAALLVTVYCHGVFDKYVNPKEYPLFVRLGLSGGGDIEEILSAMDELDGGQLNEPDGGQSISEDEQYRSADEGNLQEGEKQSFSVFSVEDIRLETFDGETDLIEGEENPTAATISVKDGRLETQGEQSDCEESNLTQTKRGKESIDLEGGQSNTDGETQEGGTLLQSDSGGAELSGENK